MLRNDMITILEYYQNKYNVSQRALCEGICSLSVVSKTKVDDREVDFFVLESLLSRLGKNVEEFEFSLNDEDFELRSIRSAIKSAMWSKDVMTVENELQVYRKMMPKESNLHEQFCLYYEMKVAECRDEWGKAKDLAGKALLLTKKEEDVPQKRHNLYSPLEMDLLLTLVHYRCGKWKEAYRVESCLRDIIEYVNTYYAVERLEDIEGRAWLELLHFLAERDDAGKLYEYIENAIDCFAKGAGVNRLAQVRFMKAQILAKKREHLCNDWNEQCREECKMAYCIYLALGKREQVAEIERFCLEELGWHITI